LASPKFDSSANLLKVIDDRGNRAASPPSGGVRNIDIKIIEVVTYVTSPGRCRILVRCITADIAAVANHISSVSHYNVVADADERR
jgi:hypothetical protein